LGVEHPLLVATVRIQRKHLTVGRAGVHRVTYLQGRVLVFSTRASALWNVTGVEGPGDLQLGYVVTGDLVQGGEAVAMGGIAPVRPVLLLCTRRDGLDRWRSFSGY